MGSGYLGILFNTCWVHWFLNTWKSDHYCPLCFSEMCGHSNSAIRLCRRKWGKVMLHTQYIWWHFWWWWRCGRQLRLVECWLFCSSSSCFIVTFFNSCQWSIFLYVFSAGLVLPEDLSMTYCSLWVICIIPTSTGDQHSHISSKRSVWSDEPTSWSKSINSLHRSVWCTVQCANWRSILVSVMYSII